VKLFLVQYCAYPSRLLVGTLVRPRPAAVLRRRGRRRPSAAAVGTTATVLTGRLTSRSCCIVGLYNSKLGESVKRKFTLAYLEI